MWWLIIIVGFLVACYGAYRIGRLERQLARDLAQPMSLLPWPGHEGCEMGAAEIDRRLAAMRERQR